MLTDTTAFELVQQLRSGSCSSQQLVQACLRRIQQLDGQIAAFRSIDAERALQRAAAIDARREANRPLGTLAGLPLAVKDIFCTRQLATTCGSRYLEHFVAPYDATVVSRLEQADGVVLGKTNLDEFAMGSSGENSAFGETRNPWDLQRVPGGSSSGSAACVAADMAPAALGTDTGGSIRQPAAFCGISGLKPTYGRVSRYGMVAFASSLDQCGPMGRSAADVALLLSVIAGHDPSDSTSDPRQTDNYLSALELPEQQPLQGLRIGRVEEQFGPGLAGEVKQSVEQAIVALQDLGATLHPVALPRSRFAVPTYYVIAPSEASGNLARYDGVHYGRRADARELESVYSQSRSEGLGAEVQRRIMLGTYALSAGYYDKHYLKALQVRRLIREDFDAAFQQVDILVGPVTPTAAYRLGEKIDDPLAMYLGDTYTVSANLAGLPAMSIPCGMTDDGLPVGLHLQASHFAETTLLRAASAYQQVTDWHRRRPPIR